jgi:hypothetical protein
MRCLPISGGSIEADPPTINASYPILVWSELSARSAYDCLSLDM